MAVDAGAARKLVDQRAEGSEVADEAKAADPGVDEPTEVVPAPPDDESSDAEAESDRPASAVRLAMAVGIVAVLVTAGLTGWLGYRAIQSREGLVQRDLFLQVARQGAVNLSTISHSKAEADVQRILDSSTGTFYDDFQKRSQPLIEVVKKAQAKSEGTVTEAGLESEEGDQAQALVAVTVKSSNGDAPEQQPRTWRMRITVQKVGDGAKVSNVQFVP